MGENNVLKKFLDAALDHNTFRITVMVLVIVRICAFLNPVVGPFVKFTLLWSFAILIKDLFTKRLFLVNRYRSILILFILCYGMTVVMNLKDNAVRNAAMFCYIVTNMLVMYAYDPQKPAGTMKKELLRFNHAFMAVTFAGQLISLVSFVLNISFIYSVGDELYYYGLYDGRLWGFFTNPNAASFLSVLNIMLTVTSLFIYGKNLPKKSLFFYSFNCLVQMLVFFLCNSRGSVLALSFYMVLMIVLYFCTKYKECPDKQSSRKLTLRIVVLSLVAPLALNGAYEYSLEILPYCVVKTEYFSEQIAEAMDASFDNEGTLDDVELVREDYGSKFGGRYYLWQAGIKIIENNPVFGVGSENVPTQAYKYAARYYTNYGDNVYLPGVSGGLHNLFFQIAASSGLAGLAVFVLFGIMVLIRCLRYYLWMCKEEKANYIAISCIAVVATIVLRTMTDTGIIYGIYYLGVVFWTYLSAATYYGDTEYQKGFQPVFLMLSNFAKNFLAKFHFRKKEAEVQ